MPLWKGKVFLIHQSSHAIEMIAKETASGC